MSNKKAAGAVILSLAFLIEESVNGISLPRYLFLAAAGFIVFAESRYRFTPNLISMMKRVLFISMIPCCAAMLYTLLGSLAEGGGGLTFLPC